MKKEYSKKKFKIVVAEDETVLQRALTLELSKAGFEVLSAENGEQLVAVVKNQHPDIAIVDILMPHLDGLAALKKIRTLPHGKELPVIMLTNLDQQQEIDKADEMGVALYYTKASVSLSELIKNIRIILRKKKE